MSSLNDIPLTIRTRAQLPGLSVNQPSNTAPLAPAQPTPAQPAPAQPVPSQPAPAQPVPAQPSQDAAKISLSVTESRAVEPVEQHRMLEPVEATTTGSSSAVVVKPEPVDDNDYTPYALTFRPKKPTGALAKPQDSARMLYDPARPIPLPTINFDRLLSSKNGEVFEPATICFTGTYRNEQLVHYLKCHGEVKTHKPQACGENCRTVVDGDMVLYGAPYVLCTRPECAEKREKRHAAVLMPKKRTRTATPSLAVREKSVGAAGDKGVRRSSRLKAYDETTAEMNQLVDNEPGYDVIAAQATGPGVRTKSMRHAGYAYTKEMKEDKMAEHVFDVTGGLSLGLDAKPKLRKELKKLHVDGTDKLRGMVAAFGLKRKADSESDEGSTSKRGAYDNLHDERPWSYASSHNARPGKKAIRNEEAPNFSIPETTYDAMVEEENGVVIEQEDFRSNRLPRYASNDDSERIGDDDGVNIFQSVETCHVCEGMDDGQLEECTGCRHHFHVQCAGIDLRIRNAEFDAEAEALDNDDRLGGQLICDGNSCEDILGAVRYKCTDDACHHFLYCKNCAQKTSANHLLEMANKGENPLAHRFFAVHGQLDEVVKQVDPEDFEFVCSECKDRRKVEKLAKQTFIKKPLPVGVIQGKVKKEQKAKAKAMDKYDVRGDIQRRVAAKKASSNPSTPLRRSARTGAIQKPSPSSSRGKHTIRINPKSLSQLQSIAEGAEDAEMGDVDV